MKAYLAEQLLARIMQWSPQEIAQQRPDLQALAAFKYDEYQQFAPGMKFLESLAVWLSQFETSEERDSAYQFVRNHLIYVSTQEFRQLISITFPDLLRPILIQKAAHDLTLPSYRVTNVVESISYHVLLRQSLFLGLSDGANIGSFRRSNPEISNEQVRLSYEITEERSTDLKNQLRDDLQSLLKREPTEDEQRFRLIFLLDDFSASGLSYLRRKDDGSFTGKINSVLKDVYGTGYLSSLVDQEQLHICIVLYIATSHAIKYLEESLQTWFMERHLTASFRILAVQIIPTSESVQEYDDAELFSLLEKYFDAESYASSHHRVGKYQYPYLGFDECGLPLVLSHNAPNNSVPLLWFDTSPRVKALFPRVSRHK